jgi:hypothetical protein
VNTLLQNLDGRQQAGLTIGITNHALLLDPAVWRRFEAQLEVPRPDYETRLQIARHYIAPMAPPDSLLKLIAWVTDKATGAEVEAACRAYKKAVAIDSPAKQPVAIFRQFAVLNVGRVSEERKDQLLMPDDQLAATWQRDSEAKFSTREIGEITGVHKSTISRRNKASRRQS